MKIFLAGEGVNDLGERAKHPSYVSDPPKHGVIEALLRKVREDGWSVAGAVCWKDIQKGRPGQHASAEAQNVKGAALRAKESGADILAFVRDRDGYPGRTDDIDDGMSRAAEIFAGQLTVVGGMAIEELESWILSLRGEPKAEGLRDPKAHLEAALKKDGLTLSTESMVALVQSGDVQALPTDATSLRLWLERAQAALQLLDG